MGCRDVRFKVGSVYFVYSSSSPMGHKALTAGFLVQLFSGYFVWDIRLRHLLCSSLLMSVLTTRQHRLDIVVVQEHLCLKAVLFRPQDGTELEEGTLSFSSLALVSFCTALSLLIKLPRKVKSWWQGPLDASGLVCCCVGCGPVNYKQGDDGSEDAPFQMVRLFQWHHAYYKIPS